MQKKIRKEKTIKEFAEVLKPVLNADLYTQAFDLFIKLGDRYSAAVFWIFVAAESLGAKKVSLAIAEIGRVAKDLDRPAQESIDTDPIWEGLSEVGRKFITHPSTLTA